MLVAVDVDPDDQVGDLDGDHPGFADLDPHAVDEHDRIHLIDRSGLPAADLIHDHVGDLGDGLSETSTPYTSARCALMSRVVMPRAYRLKIMSLVEPSRRFRFGTSRGSKLPLRSRGTSIRACPALVITVFGVAPLREFPTAGPGRVAAVVAQMIGHLDVQAPLQHRLDHPADQPIRAVDPDTGRLRVGQQRIDPRRAQQLGQPLRSASGPSPAGGPRASPIVQSRRSSMVMARFLSVKSTAPRSGHTPYTEDLTRPEIADQRRADALADLALDGLTDPDLPRRHGRPVALQVAVAATTLAGLDEEPGELTGYGPITAQVARALAGDATWRRILTDPTSGTVLDVATSTYRPPQALADLVIARDKTCPRPRLPHPRPPLRTRPHPGLPPRPHRRPQPLQRLQTQPPDETPNRLDRRTTPRQHPHLDQPHRTHLPSPTRTLPRYASASGPTATGPRSATRTRSATKA